MDIAAERWRRSRGSVSLRPPAGVVDAALGIFAAVFVGYTLVAHGSLVLVLVLGLAAVWFFTRPVLAGIALGASLPAMQDLAGANVGVHVVASDIVLVFFAARLLGDVAVGRALPVVRALRPVTLAVLPYSALMLVLFGAHVGSTSLLNTIQRFELFLLPLLVGTFLALRQEHVRVLKAYVVATTLVAVTWPLNPLHLQKNPAGQLMANAVLLLVGLPALRRFFPLLPLVALGLLATQSRGAIFATLIGVAVILLMQRGGDVRFVASRVLPLLIVAVVVFQWMPSDARARVTSFSASPGTSGGYSVYIRDRYWQDAARIASAHPLIGIGIGNYLAGDRGAGTIANDPHDVVLLEAAEGGYGLAAAFLVLVIASAFALRRMRRIALAPAAAGVLLATVAHGLVDVYWVRGTPVLGWLLVGMVCGTAAARRTARTPA
jgi:O-antigen ligase